MALIAYPVAAQQVHFPSGKGGIAELSSTGPQRRQGDLYIADGDVDIRYSDTRLRADHVEYNDKSTEAFAKGHVQFDYENEHLEAEEVHYNVSTGHGLFLNVRGTVKIERKANPALLVSENPLYFEAERVERFSTDIYYVQRTWITVCDQQNPTWKFYAQHAKIQLNQHVALINANFHLFRVPLIWLPYATAPAGQKVRQSGFLIPEPGWSSRKGYTFGDLYYWAPKPWLDASLGGEYMTSRGASQRGEFRARPFEDTSIDYNYYGVDDRGLKNSAGIRQPQGGEQQRLEVTSLLPGGWRFVSDYNQLSSLTFRLAFADTYGEAINSEVRTAIFASNNFRGFSLNVADLNDKSFLTLPDTTVVPPTPGTSVTLRSLPQVRFSSVDQAFWEKVPAYFSFDSFVDGLHRSDSVIDTPSFVSRVEFAPRVTVPFHYGDWLNMTTSAAFRTTRYGDSLSTTGQVVNQPIVRNTGEFVIDLRPPTLERFFDRPSTDKTKRHRRYKHTIEPVVTYRNVTGVNNFASFIRFDSDATLTDTDELEYGFTQRFFIKDGDDQPTEFASWQIMQKHFFDPTFGGAIVPGQRNVFQALDSITPFAFAKGPVHWSPIVSDLKVTPGGPYDFEQILEYDPNLQKISTIGTLLKVKPYSEFFATVAHFRLQADPILQPLSNQIRTLVGYGDLTRKGVNFVTGISYDIDKGTLQSQLVQASYNSGCCGLALEYRRIALGQIRTENRFSASLIIANIGSFGNLKLRHREQIF